MYRFRRVLEWKEKTVLYMERYEFEFNSPPSKPLDTKILTLNVPVLVRIYN